MSSPTDNIDIKLKFVPIVTERDGNQYLSISSNKFKLTFDTTRLYLNLADLFNGNRALSDNMNVFLNENWQIILNELKPAVREALSQILIDIINKVFAKLPFNEMFIE